MVLEKLYWVHLSSSHPQTNVSCLCVLASNTFLCVLPGVHMKSKEHEMGYCEGGKCIKECNRM